MIAHPQQPFSFFFSFSVGSPGSCVRIAGGFVTCGLGVAGFEGGFGSFT